MTWELINRKAVKAAIVLLPLLGITNVLVMVEAPLDGTALQFALWSYSSHFLTSFQGFFVALLYCFLNGEVKSYLITASRSRQKMAQVAIDSHPSNEATEGE